MTHHELVLLLLRDRSHTQKQLLFGASARVDRDDRFFAITELLAEGLIEIISRKVAIAEGGQAFGFTATRYALTDAGREAVAAQEEARRGY